MQLLKRVSVHITGIKCALIIQVWLLLKHYCSSTSTRNSGYTWLLLHTFFPPCTVCSCEPPSVQCIRINYIIVPYASHSFTFPVYNEGLLYHWKHSTLFIIIMDETLYKGDYYLKMARKIPNLPWRQHTGKRASKNAPGTLAHTFTSLWIKPKLVSIGLQTWNVLINKIVYPINYV